MRVGQAAGIVAALAAALAAGCGSSGSRTVTQTAQTVAQTAAAPPTRPSKDDFIASADKLCAHANRRLKPVILRIIRLDQSSQPLAFRLSGYRDGFHDFGVAYEDLVAELQQLQRAPGGDRVMGRMLRLMDSIPLYLDRLQASITNLDALSFVRAEIKINRTAVRIGGIADGYGFNVCGVVPGRNHRDEGPFPGARPA